MTFYPISLPISSLLSQNDAFTTLYIMSRPNPTLPQHSIPHCYRLYNPLYDRHQYLKVYLPWYPHSIMILIGILRPNTTLRLQFIYNHSVSLSTPACSETHCQSPQISKHPVIGCGVIGNGPSMSDSSQGSITKSEIFTFWNQRHHMFIAYRIWHKTDIAKNITHSVLRK